MSIISNDSIDSLIDEMIDDLLMTNKKGADGAFIHNIMCIN